MPMHVPVHTSMTSICMAMHMPTQIRIHISVPRIHGPTVAVGCSTVHESRTHIILPCRACLSTLLLVTPFDGGLVARFQYDVYTYSSGPRSYSLYSHGCRFQHDFTTIENCVSIPGLQAHVWHTCPCTRLLRTHTCVHACTRAHTQEALGHAAQGVEPATLLETCACHVRACVRAMCVRACVSARVQTCM